MKVDVAPLREEHFAELRGVLDAVAREGRYLALRQAPAMEEAVSFYRTSIERDYPHFVALAQGRVVGWCDVRPAFGQSRAHAGILGIGLLPEYRGGGNGGALMAAAIERAWEKGFTRIELTVRADNVSARKLYERLGFVAEGTHPHAFRVGKQYFDSLSMGLLRP